jgi:hypothetical protein
MQPFIPICSAFILHHLRELLLLLYAISPWFYQGVNRKQAVVFAGDRDNFFKTSLRFDHDSTIRNSEFALRGANRKQTVVFADKIIPGSE